MSTDDPPVWDKEDNITYTFEFDGKYGVPAAPAQSDVPSRLKRQQPPKRRGLWPSCFAPRMVDEPTTVTPGKPVSSRLALTAKHLLYQRPLGAERSQIVRLPFSEICDAHLKWIEAGGARVSKVTLTCQFGREPVVIRGLKEPEAFIHTLEAALKDAATNAASSPSCKQTQTFAGGPVSTPRATNTGAGNGNAQPSTNSGDKGEANAKRPLFTDVPPQSLSGATLRQASASSSTRTSMTMLSPFARGVAQQFNGASEVAQEMRMASPRRRRADSRIPSPRRERPEPARQPGTPRTPSARGSPPNSYESHSTPPVDVHHVESQATPRAPSGTLTSMGPSLSFGLAPSRGPPVAAPSPPLTVEDSFVVGSSFQVTPDGSPHPYSRITARSPPPAVDDSVMSSLSGHLTPSGSPGPGALSVGSITPPRGGESSPRLAPDGASRNKATGQLPPARVAALRGGTYVPRSLRNGSPDGGLAEASSLSASFAGGPLDPQVVSAAGSVSGSAPGSPLASLANLPEPGTPRRPDFQAPYDANFHGSGLGGLDPLSAVAAGEEKATPRLVPGDLPPQARQAQDPGVYDDTRLQQAGTAGSGATGMGTRTVSASSFCSARSGYPASAYNSTHGGGSQGGEGSASTLPCAGTGQIAAGDQRGVTAVGAIGLAAAAATVSAVLTSAATASLSGLAAMVLGSTATAATVATAPVAAAAVGTVATVAAPLSLMGLTAAAAVTVVAAAAMTHLKTGSPVRPYSGQPEEDNARVWGRALEGCDGQLLQLAASAASDLSEHEQQAALEPSVRELPALPHDSVASREIVPYVPSQDARPDGQTGAAAASTGSGLRRRWFGFGARPRATGSSGPGGSGTPGGSSGTATGSRAWPAVSCDGSEAGEGTEGAWGSQPTLVDSDGEPVAALRHSMEACPAGQRVRARVTSEGTSGHPEHDSASPSHQTAGFEDEALPLMLFSAGMQHLERSSTTIGGSSSPRSPGRTAPGEERNQTVPAAGQRGRQAQLSESPVGVLYSVDAMTRVVSSGGAAQAQLAARPKLRTCEISVQTEVQPGVMAQTERAAARSAGGSPAGASYTSVGSSASGRRGHAAGLAASTSHYVYAYDGLKRGGGGGAAVVGSMAGAQDWYRRDDDGDPHAARPYENDEERVRLLRSSVERQGAAASVSVIDQVDAPELLVQWQPQLRLTQEASPSASRAAGPNSTVQPVEPRPRRQRLPDPLAASYRSSESDRPSPSPSASNAPSSGLYSHIHSDASDRHNSGGAACSSRDRHGASTAQMYYGRGGTSGGALASNSDSQQRLLSPEQGLSAEPLTPAVPRAPAVYRLLASASRANSSRQSSSGSCGGPAESKPEAAAAPGPLGRLVGEKQRAAAPAASSTGPVTGNQLVASRYAAAIPSTSTRWTLTDLGPLGTGTESQHAAAIPYTRTAWTMADLGPQRVDAGYRFSSPSTPSRKAAGTSTSPRTGQKSPDLSDLSSAVCIMRRSGTSPRHQWPAVCPPYQVPWRRVASTTRAGTPGFNSPPRQAPWRRVGNSPRVDGTGSASAPRQSPRSDSPPHQAPWRRVANSPRADTSPPRQSTHSDSPPHQAPWRRVANSPHADTSPPRQPTRSDSPPHQAPWRRVANSPRADTSPPHQSPRSECPPHQAPWRQVANSPPADTSPLRQPTRSDSPPHQAPWRRVANSPPADTSPPRQPPRSDSPPHQAPWRRVANSPRADTSLPRQSPRSESPPHQAPWRRVANRPPADTSPPRQPPRSDSPPHQAPWRRVANSPHADTSPPRQSPRSESPPYQAPWRRVGNSPRDETSPPRQSPRSDSPPRQAPWRRVANSPPVDTSGSASSSSHTRATSPRGASSHLDDLYMNPLYSSRTKDAAIPVARTPLHSARDDMMGQPLASDSTGSVVFRSYAGATASSCVAGLAPLTMSSVNSQPDLSTEGRVRVAQRRRTRDSMMGYGIPSVGNPGESIGGAGPSSTGPTAAGVMPTCSGGVYGDGLAPMAGRPHDSDGSPVGRTASGGESGEEEDVNAPASAQRIKRPRTAVQPTAAPALPRSSDSVLVTQISLAQLLQPHVHQHQQQSIQGRQSAGVSARLASPFMVLNPTFAQSGGSNVASPSSEAGKEENSGTGGKSGPKETVDFIAGAVISAAVDSAVAVGEEKGKRMTAHLNAAGYVTPKHHELRGPVHDSSAGWGRSFQGSPTSQQAVHAASLLRQANDAVDNARDAVQRGDVKWLMQVTTTLQAVEVALNALREF